MENTAGKIRSNTIKYIIFQMLYGTAIVLSSGAVVHAFAEYLGLVDKVSVYSSVIQIVQVVAMMICSLRCDGIKRIIKAVAASVVVVGVTSVGLLFVCAGIPAETSDIYTFILITSCVSSAGLGIYNVLIYKLPYSIYDIREFGKYSALCGTASGICGFVCTLLISVFSKCFPYKVVITVAFAVGLVLFIAAILICFSFEEVENVNEKPTEEKINLFRLPEFTKLIIPNLLRGIGNGMVALVTVIGISAGVLDLSSAVHVATVTAIGSMSGFVAYLVISRFVSVRAQTVISSCVVLAVFPLSMSVGNTYVFFALYFITYAALTAFGNCIPVLVYGGIKRGIIGRYTAWRMLLFTAGSAIPGFFMNALLESAGAAVTALIAGACTVVCGAVYVAVMGKNRK